MIGKTASRKMRVTWGHPPRWLFVAVGLFVVGAHCDAASPSKAVLPPEILSFITNKVAQAHVLTKELDLKVAGDVWAYFGTALTGTITAITNAFGRLSLKKRSSQDEGSNDDPTLGTPVWHILIEVELAVEGFADGDPKLAVAFGKGVIRSIPPGSIYFGGTDPGRGLVTALCKSHAEADPFFTISQNALTDGRYLDYLRAMYGKKIRTPSAKDSTGAFQEYLQDAQKRLEHDRRLPGQPRQLKPGEDVRIVDNRVRVSGQMSVIGIRELLTRTIFDANPDREFYIEESFPLDWMYPHLSPRGWIFKLNREPLARLSDEAVEQDRQFWIRQQAELIGGWLTPDTPVQEVCAFVRKTFGRKDWTGFNGDRHFIEQDYANRLYSKLRSSIGGLYNWRLTNSKSAEERQRMMAEADFAFRQAFAFCPHNPEVVFRYVNLLMSADRTEDALSVAGAAQSLEPDNSQLANLVSELTRLKWTKTK